jgi:hypothetical protein
MHFNSFSRNFNTNVSFLQIFLLGKESNFNVISSFKGYPWNKPQIFLKIRGKPMVNVNPWKKPCTFTKTHEKRGIPWKVAALDLLNRRRRRLFPQSKRTYL